MPLEIRRVGERLKKLFSFTSYVPLDSVVVQGTEGDSVAYPVGGEWRLEFLLEPSGHEEVVRLRDLTLSRSRKDGPREAWRDVVRTTINVPTGQPYVLGVGKDEGARGAIFLVFLAQPRATTPGPGIAGLR
jgi:hypothetical protein